uniref:NADH-ubiquinone oxidoreductase chain 6 n=1 Tax=Kryptolebias marmoratus TaxID=37003 RepID=C7FKL2_KRYMA|nr:NADH dehydrogenase subunit 6 [Kryptolebias marmoratus]
MKYLLFLLLFLLILGVVGVASNPSPGFAALSLVMVAGSGCSLLAGQGGYFLALILFLIYLGGMLVVFAYSVAFTGSDYVEGWGTRRISLAAAGYLLLVWGGGVILSTNLNEEFWTVGASFGEFMSLEYNLVGVAHLYMGGGWLLVAGAWALLLVLLAVLELVRGASRGAVRVV